MPAMPAGVPVVHLVTAELDRGRAALLRLLLDQRRAPQAVLQLGPGRLDRGSASIPTIQLRKQMNRPNIRSLGQALAVLAARFGTAPLWHVWTDAALAWWSPSLDAPGGMIEAAPGMDCRSAISELTPLGRWRFVTATQCARENLAQQGVPRAEAAVVRDIVDFAALDAAASRAAPRAGDARTAVLVPPVNERSGAALGTWATLLVEKIHARLRLIVPSRGPEVAPLRHLVTSCGHKHVVRFVDAALPWHALFGEADVALFTPDGPAPTAGLAWALATNLRIVATDVPIVRELVGQAQGVWLSPAAQPRAVAQCLLAALDAPDSAGEWARERRQLAHRLFEPEAALTHYDELYAAIGKR